MKRTYSAIKRQLAKLERQAEALRKSEVAGVIAKIKQAIKDYGLRARCDLGLGQGAARSAGTSPSKPGTRASKTKGVAKYRDPESGKTWTGRGKPPAWIAGVKNRDPYLIDRQAGEMTGQMPPKRIAGRLARLAALQRQRRRGGPREPAPGLFVDLHDPLRRRRRRPRSRPGQLPCSERPPRCGRAVARRGSHHRSLPAVVAGPIRKAAAGDARWPRRVGAVCAPPSYSAVTFDIKT